VSTLAIATPPMIVIVMVLTLVAVIGNGKRAKRAARLLGIYLNAPADGTSGTKLDRQQIPQK
jgi:hypothetical protein